MPNYISANALFTVNSAHQESLVALLGRISAEQPQPSILLKALFTLMRDGAKEVDFPSLMDGASPVEMARFHFIIERFDDAGWLNRTLNDERGFHVLTLEPVIPKRLITRPLSHDTLLVISNYAFVRKEGVGFLMEAPLAHVRVRAHSDLCLSLFAQLNRPIAASEAIERADKGIERSLGMSILSAFLCAGVAEEFNDSSLSLEAEAEGWEFHDLLFHTRSREGWTGEPCGATYRFQKSPAAFASSENPVIFSLSNRRTTQSYRLFLDVLQKRRTVRNHSSSITINQLADLLAFAVGNKEATSGNETRPYPNAGGAYELEIYAVINSCEGVSNGLYHYDVSGEKLVFVAPDVSCILEDARLACGANTPPDVLLVLTARFRKISWKYQSIAYSLILKDAGVLLQTLSLTAEALDLGSCIIGTGNGRIFCETARLRFLEESPVAELAIFGGRYGK